MPPSGRVAFIALIPSLKTIRLTSRFGRVNQIRRDRVLTYEELMGYVPSVFDEDNHASRSERYAFIPTITLLKSPPSEGFEPCFVCQIRVRDLKAKGISDYEGTGRKKQKLSGHKTESQVLMYDRKIKISPTLNKKMR